jgi:hypothetical protein
LISLLTVDGERPSNLAIWQSIASIDTSQELWIFPRALPASMPALSGVVAQDEFPVRRQLKINRR